MSRAFMKDRDDAPEPTIVIDRPLEHPMTPAGIADLRRQVDVSVDPAERAALEERLAAAVLLEPPEDHAEIGFGATVTVAEASKTQHVFTIVGDDEIDIPSGKIGLTSPLAEALIGAHPGDAVVWKRPAGDLTLKVRSVRYS